MRILNKSNENKMIGRIVETFQIELSVSVLLWGNEES